MSKENVESLRRAFEAFAAGDLEALFELLDPDVVYRPAIASILGVEALRGKEAVQRFLAQDLFDGFDEFSAEPLSFEDLGDKVLVPTRYKGRGESTGLEIDQTFVAVYTLAGGRITAQCDYETRSEALAAEGPRE